MHSRPHLKIHSLIWNIYHVSAVYKALQGVLRKIKAKGVNNSGSTEHSLIVESSALWMGKHHPGTDSQICMEQECAQPPYPQPHFHQLKLQEKIYMRKRHSACLEPLLGESYIKFSTLFQDKCKVPILFKSLSSGPTGCGSCAKKMETKISVGSTCHQAMILLILIHCYLSLNFLLDFYMCPSGLSNQITVLQEQKSLLTLPCIKTTLINMALLLFSP